MKIIKIFLASSSELLEDRQTFEVFLNRRNKVLIKENIFLELVIWEDFLDAVSQTRLQDTYNEALKKCDLFIMLFYTKVGKYTKEEFDTAYKEFKENNSPLIFTYFKNAPSDTAPQESLDVFKKYLSDLGHFYTVYENLEGLQLHFMQQFEKMRNEGLLDITNDKPTDSVTPAKQVVDIKVIEMVKTEIGNGKDVDDILDKYMDQLIAISEEAKNDLAMIKGRSKELAKKIRRGIIRSDEASLTRSQINFTLLDLLDEIKKEAKTE